MSNSERVQNLLAGAIELPPEQRGAYLDAACRGDQALRAEVESLLLSHDEAGRFMDEPTMDELPSAQGASSAMTSHEGKMIGRYKLLQPIGEGGFGVVYMAEQREPVKRRVALKIIKLGMDTKQVIARFEAERQALAMMDHPNIAKVLDAGSTDTGRPYFVMEYIKGVPIIEYCDTEKLDMRGRLALFMSVCHAIQHAHQKGIIHRDIKPSNVLVTMHDGVPVPKVIDFGIAKATSAELTTRTLFTEHRQMIGTPAYMSPEQAEMSGLDIDTRSDIYSLGVLLYELLTGTTPFESKSLMEAGFAEMMRIIREVEPHKPSTRLSSLGATGTRTAEQRHLADVKKLGLLLKGDLDWIVMKCLKKDRTRRYETANGLADDIKRHLSDEPVTAGAPGAGYRLRKFARRNRAQVIAAGVIAAALVLGVIGTSAGLVWALREKAKATLSANSEAVAKGTAQENERKAVAAVTVAEASKEVEAMARKRAEASGNFVVAALKSADAENSGGEAGTKGAGRDMTVLAAMDNAIRDLDSGRFRDDPVAEAELRDTIGIILRNNGRYAEAQPLLERALAIRERIFPADDPMVAHSLYDLAELYEAQDRSAEAEALLARSAAIYEKALGPDDPTLASVLNDLAGVCRTLGQDARAEQLWNRALAIHEKAFGPDHLEVATDLHGIALLYHRQRQFAKAEPLYARALAIREKILGPDHPRTLRVKADLAALYWSQRRLDRSVPLFEEVLKAQEATLGREHPGTLHTIANLGVNYRDAGRLAEAIPLLEEGYRSSKKYPDMAFVGPELLKAYGAAIDPAKPETTARTVALLRELLSAQRAKLPAGSPELAGQLAACAQSLLTLKAWDDAESMIRECLAIREKTQPDDWTTFNTQSMLGGALLGQGKLAEAEPLLLDGYAGMKQREASIPPVASTRIPEALERLVQFYKAKGDDAETASWKIRLEQQDRATTRSAATQPAATRPTSSSSATNGLPK